MARKPPGKTELERRRLQAERRQRYRGDRKRPYQPRGIRGLRGRFVQITLLIDRRTKREAYACARRAGLSFAAWSRELIEDAVRIDARSRETT